MLNVEAEKRPSLYDDRPYFSPPPRLFPEAFAAIFMRLCMPAQIEAVKVPITAFSMNNCSCKLSSGKSRGESQRQCSLNLLETKNVQP